MTDPWNGRPPAPLDEVDGWHCFYDLDIGITYQQWCPKSGIWMTPSNRWMTPGDITDGEYYGAVLTPDQIAAQIAEAVKAEREELCAALEEAAVWHEEHDKALSKQPQNADILWRRMNHQEQRDDLRAAIRARGETA